MCLTDIDPTPPQKKNKKNNSACRHTQEWLRSAESIPILSLNAAVAGGLLKHVLTQRNFIHRNQCLLHTGIYQDTL